MIPDKSNMDTPNIVNMDLVTVNMDLIAANKQLALANAELTGAITQLTDDNSRLTAVVATMTGVARCLADLARSGNAASPTDQVCVGNPSAAHASVWPTLYAPRCSPVSTRSRSPSISTTPTADPMLSSAAVSSPDYSPFTPALYDGMSTTEDSRSPPSTAALYSGLSADDEDSADDGASQSADGEDSADDGGDEADDGASQSDDEDSADDAASPGSTATHPVRVDDATDEEEAPLIPGTVSSHPVDLTDACGCSTGCDEESVAIAGGPARLLGCSTDPPHPLKPSADAVLWDRLTRVEVGVLIF